MPIKLITILMLMLILTGCGPKAALRQGTICIPEISTKGYTTSDPVDIKQDVVDKTAEMLRKYAINYISKASALKYIDTCDTAIYMLNISLNRLDTESEYEHSFWTKKTKSKRIYTAGVSCVFKKNKEVIRIYDVSEDEEGLDSTLKEVAESVIETIEKE